MKIKGLIFVLGIVLLVGAVSAYSGDYNGTNIENVGEVNVSADVSATQYWFQLSLGSEDIDFGNVKPREKWNTYRTKYDIQAKGNVNVTVRPELVNNSANNLFLNLYFSKDYESKLSNWKKIGDYELKFNLSGDEGIELRNPIDPKTGNLTKTKVHSILLNLESYDEIIPFPETRQNIIRFVAIPDWNSVPDL